MRWLLLVFVLSSSCFGQEPIPDPIGDLPAGEAPQLSSDCCNLLAERDNLVQLFEYNEGLIDEALDSINRLELLKENTINDPTMSGPAKFEIITRCQQRIRDIQEEIRELELVSISMWYDIQMLNGLYLLYNCGGNNPIDWPAV